MINDNFEKPIYLAHDHMNRLEDFARDAKGGVSVKILHLTVDGWINAPSKKEYLKTYYSYEGFYDRYLLALNQLHKVIANNSDQIKLVTSYRDLQDAGSEKVLAVILGNEGGKIVGESGENLNTLFDLGVRHIQLNWSMKNCLSASQSEENTRQDTGLSDLGRNMIERMNELGMIVDVSHSSPETISDVLDVTSKPILNSHSGSRVIANKQQNLWDEQIRQLSENGGILAIHFCSRLVLGVDDRQSTIPDVISQIKYVKNKGGIDLIGLGPDWILGDTKRDEKYMHNTEQETITWTKCLEDSSRIKNLIPQLQLAGFSEHEIDRILYLNLQRFFKAVLPS